MTDRDNIDFYVLPLVNNLDDVKRVHRDSDLYLVKRGGVAHGEPLDCLHVDPSLTVARSSWRVATAAQCRSLSFSWCDSCCS